MELFLAWGASSFANVSSKKCCSTRLQIVGDGNNTKIDKMLIKRKNKSIPVR